MTNAAERDVLGPEGGERTTEEEKASDVWLTDFLLDVRRRNRLTDESGL